MRNISTSHGLNFRPTAISDSYDSVLFSIISGLGWIYTISGLSAAARTGYGAGPHVQLTAENKVLVGQKWNIPDMRRSKDTPSVHLSKVNTSTICFI